TFTVKGKLYIGNRCEIRNGEIGRNDEIIFSAEGQPFSAYSREAYRSLEINYPKFLKMDKLSKLEFLAASQLLSGSDNTALVFANRSASLDTDQVYHDSIARKEDYYPSPAVFVYTLPNICLGEISIKYKLYSENSFFVFETFPYDF